MIRSGIFDCSI